MTTGLLEKFSTARHSLGFYNNVAVTAHYANPSIHGPFSELVYQALAAVIVQHPILSAIPINEDEVGTSFVRLPQIDLWRTVTFVTRKHGSQHGSDQTDNELDGIIEKQHNTDFKECYGELPFWRVIILHPDETRANCVVSFIFHHALCDGASGLAFHRAFLSALNAVPELHTASGGAGANAMDPIVYPPKTPLLPSLEELHPLPLSLSFFVKTMWNEFVARSPQNVWTALPITNSMAMRQTRFRSFSLSFSTTQNLLTVSRTYSTSLTAAIEMILAEVLFKHLTTESYSTLIAQGAISLRRFLPRNMIDDDSMGTYASAYKYVHQRPGNESFQGPHLTAKPFPWDEACKVKATIDIELAKKGNDNVIGLLRYAGNLHTFLSKKVGKEREQSFEVSNIGVFKSVLTGQSDKSWSIGRMVFSQCSNVAGPALNLSMVTGGDGCLTMGISWLEGVVETEWAQLVLKDLKSMIEELAK